MLKSSDDFLKTHPHLKDFMTFLSHLNTESERGAVLIAATMLDDLLVNAINAYFIEGDSARKLTEGFNAPLGTFAARIEAASAMGIINQPEYHDLTIIRKIRNDFAHSITTKFSDDSIKNRCTSLLASAKSYGDVIVDAKGLFTSAAASVILKFVNRAHYVSLERLKPKVWKY